MLESALSAYLAALPDATTLLNRLHAFFGVGALVGPALAAWIVSFTARIRARPQGEPEPELTG